MNIKLCNQSSNIGRACKPNDQRHIDGKKHQDFLKKYSKQPRIDGTTEQRLHHRSATLPNLSVENEFAVVILFFCCSIRFSSCIIWCSYKQTQPEENKWEANRQKLAELREQSYKSVLFEILSPWTNSYVFPLRRLHKTAKVLFPLKFRVAQAAQRESRILPLSLIDPK